MIKRQVEQFLIEKRGYAKVAPIKVAEMMWRNSDTYVLPRTSYELNNDLELIKKVQQEFRQNKKLESLTFDSRLQEIYNLVLIEKNKPKRILYFDLETSPNIVYSWSVGYKLNISPESIISERAIICVAYKWDNEEEVHTIQWNKGDDKELCKQFAKIANEASIICGHNLDKYDLPFLRTRCLIHGVQLNRVVNSLDTLKMARSKFRLNSNKLDYISGFLGYEGKSQTSFGLWKDIVMNDCPIAMKTMVDYCANDVKIQEQVHLELKKYIAPKKFE